MKLTFPPPPLVLLLAAAPLMVAGCEDDCVVMPQGSPTADQISYRNPDTGLCEGFGGGGGRTATNTCDDDWAADAEEPGGAQLAWAACYSACDGLEEATCLETAGCRAAYTTECGPDALCDEAAVQQLAYLGCWAMSPAGPATGSCDGLDAFACSMHDDCSAVHYTQEAFPNPAGSEYGPFAYCMSEPEYVDPGSCVGDIVCLAESPDCPENTVPGRKDGCWTGFCIPEYECDELPACGELGEAACVERGDCDAIYEGIDCTCNDAGVCDCAEWIYSTCEEMTP